MIISHFSPTIFWTNFVTEAESHEQNYIRTEVQKLDEVPRNLFEKHTIIETGAFGQVYRGVLFNHVQKKYAAIAITELRDMGPEEKELLKQEVVSF